ncbi:MULTISPECIES: ABC transporter permease [Shewanella]|jgi:tungstate transport system permease protein|uniref:Binding-protein-dependent transport systems inner membrane component n=3 Tax=Gammaproteobacteria TaxID=1236 RepID=Q07W71_SHEFN|nr:MULTISPECIES: ABC transporter permease [Shewanella]MBB1381881.1 ABC transporter permease [Shewanella sp. SR41-2]ABI73743.1 binding-protein-dependent transport systems inner membrane component [Shewanella frigidimarina NCIMB 400]KVX00651.1 ABC transporter permease [Shewanella frigidimarina]MBB1425238.1 ABC transporter permease [Shewanella sp. SG44-2]MBB1439824.1 ABC transporter permease [Shewanella sp. SG41-4]|tara:strand:- start:124 stop:831 length:708 start_codon:yes stop_codon:yes gene_type:complete
MSDGWLALLQQAFSLLLSFDPHVWAIINISFSVSFAALLITIIPSMMLGFILAFSHFRGRWIVTNLVQTLQSIPTVVIGLLVYLLLTRNGVLGDLKWLFTQKGMILGQMLICAPVLIALSQAAFASVDRRAWETSRTLGASWLRAVWTLCRELRGPLLLAIIAAFSRILTEVGCSMMVGGNIMNVTRNIPTAIALETSKGDFAQAIALGLVLLILAVVLNFILGSLRGKALPRSH